MSDSDLRRVRPALLTAWSISSVVLLVSLWRLRESAAADIHFTGSGSLLAVLVFAAVFLVSWALLCYQAWFGAPKPPGARRLLTFLFWFFLLVFTSMLLAILGIYDLPVL